MGRYTTLTEEISRYNNLIGIEESVKIPLEEIDFENTFSDVKRQCVTPDEVVDFLNKQLNKNDSVSQEMPVIPTAFATRLMKDGGVTVQKVIKEITFPPKTIWVQNGKISKSSDEKTIFFNMGIPAYKAIVYDIEKQQFYFVLTCPGSDKCLGHCYAMKNNYIMFEPKILAATRIINYLLNYPEAFKRKLESELDDLCLSHRDKEINLRWHDSGDFFAMTYIKIARDITDFFTTQHYNIKSYAYTKVAEALSLSSSNFIIRLSDDMSAVEKSKVKDDGSLLWASTVPKHVTKGMFVQAVVTDNKGRTKKSAHPLKDDEGHWILADASGSEIKQAVADTYNLNINSIVMNSELKNIPAGSRGTLYAIVPPHEDDISAIRRDVKTVFLLIH
jgi:hypothetical protein